MKNSNGISWLACMHAFTSIADYGYDSMINKPAKYMPRKKSQKKIRLEKRRRRK